MAGMSRPNTRTLPRVVAAPCGVLLPRGRPRYASVSGSWSVADPFSGFVRVGVVGGNSGLRSFGLVWICQGVWWMTRWWWPQRRARLSGWVVPWSAQCRMWSAWHVTGGRVQWSTRSNPHTRPRPGAAPRTGVRDRRRRRQHRRAVLSGSPHRPRLSHLAGAPCTCQGLQQPTGAGIPGQPGIPTALRPARVRRGTPGLPSLLNQRSIPPPRPAELPGPPSAAGTSPVTPVIRPLAPKVFGHVGRAGSRPARASR